MRLEQAHTGTPTLEHGHWHHHHGCGCVVMLGLMFALALGAYAADQVYEGRHPAAKADKEIHFRHFKKKDGSPRFPGIVHMRQNLQDLGDGAVKFIVGGLALPAFVEAFVPMVLLFLGLLFLGLPIIVVVGIVAILLARNHQATVTNGSVEMQTGYFDIVPVVMACILPGCGQYMQGRDCWKKWLVVTILAWLFSCGLLGWVVHIFSGCDAYKWEMAKVPPDGVAPTDPT